ncbi:MAG: ATP-dependent RecD-like DNA helicase [Clostridia bacterium]|nr:ATP-dependent RecD-like DNA helicase [Clostridia bacterium]
MKIKGCVSEIIYRNEDNNYSVFVLEQDDDALVAVVGKLPPFSVGQNLELEGEFVFNTKFGRQFSVEKVTFVQPTNTKGIYKYLCSGLIKGVGPVTAKNLVDYFKEDTLNIIELYPDRLTEVKGISKNKADQIAKTYNDIREMQNTIIFLQQFEVSTLMAVKIYEFYGPKTKMVMEENPYKLVEDVDGIGFSTADKIAAKMGVMPNSEFRFRAALLHILNETVEKSGNTFLPYDTAVKNLFKLLNLTSEEDTDIDLMEVVENVIFKLCIDDKVKIIEFDGLKGIIPSKLYYTEKNIATRIFQMLYSNSLPTSDVSKEIAMYEKINKITLHEKQKQAISTAVNNNISIITGGPGTGKTTIIKCAISIFKSQGKSFLLMAPTGRAAKRLNESTGEEAKTIHRALDLDFKNGKGKFYTFDEHNPLPYDVVIVDEVSMIDCFLMNSLLKALKRTAQLILVGDKNQLPSVGAGNVLADILQSKKVKTSVLTEIYRQDSNSYIILNAHSINKGEMPVLDNSCNDFFFEKKEDLNDMCETIIQLQSKRLPNYFKIDPFKIQVLAPMKNGVCGIDNLNRRLQDALNPKSKFKNEIVTERFIYRVGDKVMQTENNYEQEWSKNPDSIFAEDGLGVFNGDMGVIEEINPSTGELKVVFDDGRISIYNRTNILQLVLSYAITIHKSQGSEFDIVIIPAILGANTILTRNLLYTAVTRAKKAVMIVGTKFAISRMILNNYTLERYTTLKYFLNNKEDFFN